MTTMLTINAVSTLLAAVGMGGYLVRLSRRGRRDVTVKPVYVPGHQP